MTYTRECPFCGKIHFVSRVWSKVEFDEEGHSHPVGESEECVDGMRACWHSSFIPLEIYNNRPGEDAIRKEAAEVIENLLKIAREYYAFGLSGFELEYMEALAWTAINGEKKWREKMVVFKIRNKLTGLFAGIGSIPAFTKEGRTFSESELKRHLSMKSYASIEAWYKNCEIVGYALTPVSRMDFGPQEADKLQMTIFELIDKKEENNG